MQTSQTCFCGQYLRFSIMLRSMKTRNGMFCSLICFLSVTSSAHAQVDSGIQKFFSSIRTELEANADFNATHFYSVDEDEQTFLTLQNKYLTDHGDLDPQSCEYTVTENKSVLWQGPPEAYEAWANQTKMEYERYADRENGKFVFGGYIEKGLLKKDLSREENEDISMASLDEFKASIQKMILAKAANGYKVQKFVMIPSDVAGLNTDWAHLEKFFFDELHIEHQRVKLDQSPNAKDDFHFTLVPKTYLSAVFHYQLAAISCEKKPGIPPVQEENVLPPPPVAKQSPEYHPHQDQPRNFYIHDHFAWLKKCLPHRSSGRNARGWGRSSGGNQLGCPK